MSLVALACLRGAGGAGASGGQVRVRPWPALAEARPQLAPGLAPWLQAAGARRSHAYMVRIPEGAAGQARPGLGAGVWCRRVYWRPRPNTNRGLRD